MFNRGGVHPRPTLGLYKGSPRQVHQPAQGERLSVRGRLSARRQPAPGSLDHDPRPPRPGEEEPEASSPPRRGPHTSNTPHKRTVQARNGLTFPPVVEPRGQRPPIPVAVYNRRLALTFCLGQSTFRCRDGNLHFLNRTRRINRRFIAAYISAP